MKFKKITIENFKSIGTNPVVVNLDFNNTTLLTGSNGVGKTSITEAIVWCIYGVTKLKADNVVNKTVGENTKVELEFTENNKNYVITRYRKHRVHKNNVYIFENGENISLKNQADNQELIQKIVGIDPRAFMSSIVLSSETYKQFLRETNSVRLQIFESVFSLRELNDFKKYTLQKIKLLDSQITTKNNELVSVSSYNEADTNTLRAYKENYDNQIEKLNAQITLYKMNLAKCEEDLKNDSEIDFDAEMKKAVEYQAKLTVYENDKKNLDKMMGLISSYDSQISELESKQLDYEKTLNDYSVDFFKEELKKTTEYEKNIKTAEDIKSKISEVDNLVKINNAKIDSLQKEINSKVSEKDDANRQLDNIKTSICPTCGHTLDEHKGGELKKKYSDIISRLKEDIESLEDDKDYLGEQIGILNSQIKGLKEELSGIDIAKPKYSQQEIKFLAQKYKEANDNKDIIVSQIAEKERELFELKQKIKVSATIPPVYDGYTVEWLNENKSKQVKLASEIESLKSQIAVAEKMKETAFDRNYVQKLMTSIKERNTIIERLNSEIFSYRKEMSQYQVLDDIFSNGDNGFKKYFINKTIDMFNNKINTFLPFFFDDEIEIKFDKNLNESITFRGKETDFEELSSGEKTRAELCVIFSLYFMVQSLFGCGTNLLVVDELLDRGLDEKGIKASKSILDDISKESSVFVVTHRDDLKELFSSVLTVYKDGDGFTRTK